MRNKAGIRAVTLFHVVCKTWSIFQYCNLIDGGTNQDFGIQPVMISSILSCICLVDEIRFMLGLCIWVLDSTICTEKPFFSDEMSNGMVRQPGETFPE